jgi:lysyl-tRNA synthetase, class I
MSWVSEIVNRADPPFVINDSKTPSGRAHVGALRGVLIHDSLYRFLKASSNRVAYTFGSDDYDALDELPHGLEDYYRAYLGVPLCNVPAPPGSPVSDVADHYISEFFDIFQKLDVAAKTYRMRDLYRSGQMDEPIQRVLENRSRIREIYYEVNGSVKPEDWHPLQVVCPSCGKIGTTLVIAFRNNLVQFRCMTNHVKWAVGCGKEGWISPFEGNAKLPWKIEWAARWSVLGVTIEGAGKDHTTRGGSRDVANAVATEILDVKPPLNLPYEFFLVGGSKMSSSKGIGVSAAEIAELLPPHLLRFLLVRTPPRRTVNFSPDLESISRLYADYDRVLSSVESSTPPNRLAAEQLLLTSVQNVGPETSRVGKMLPWDTIVSLVQLPHLDFLVRANERFDPPLTEVEKRHLQQRIQSARIWLEQYADPGERIEINLSEPRRVPNLTNSQLAFLSVAAQLLTVSNWDPDEVQAALFDAARLTPLDHTAAFSALYLTFLGKNSGPRAGNLLSFFDKDLVIGVLRNSGEYSRRTLVEETRVPEAEALARLARRDAEIEDVVLTPEFLGDSRASEGGNEFVDAVGVVNVVTTSSKGRREILRVEVFRVQGIGSTLEVEHDYFQNCVNEFSNAILTQFDSRAKLISS